MECAVVGFWRRAVVSSCISGSVWFWSLRDNSAGFDTWISFLYAQTTFGVMKQAQIKIVCRPGHDCASQDWSRNADPVVVGRSHH